MFSHSSSGIILEFIYLGYEKLRPSAFCCVLRACVAVSPYEPRLLLAFASPVLSHHYCWYPTCVLPPLFCVFLRRLDMPYLDTRSEGHLWLRDFQSQIQPNETQRNTLIVAGVYVVVILILWCVFFFPLQFRCIWTLKKYDLISFEGIFPMWIASVSSVSFCVVKMLTP